MSLRNAGAARAKRSGGHSCRARYSGSTAPRRHNRCGSRTRIRCAPPARPSSKHISGSRMSVAVLFAIVSDRNCGQSHRAGLVHRLDDKLHVRRVVDLEVEAGVPPSGLLDDLKDGLHHATFASSASGIVSSAADDSKAARMTAEVCWMTSSDSASNDALPW